MTIPRALVGSVRCMARPARPAREVAAVREAATLVRADMPGAAAPAVARVIAGRVIAELLIEVDGFANDPFMAAIQKVRRSPFVLLATCPEIDTLSEFVERRIIRLRARSGAYLSAAAQMAERSALAGELEMLLTGRYLRHLRGSL